MMFGLGTDSTETKQPAPPAATPLPTFTDGLKVWGSPGTAVTVLGAVAKNPGLAFASDAVGFTAGVLVVPLAAVLLLMNMDKH